jgi:hypothetical protein
VKIVLAFGVFLFQPDQVLDSISSSLQSHLHQRRLPTVFGRLNVFGYAYGYLCDVYV